MREGDTMAGPFVVCVGTLKYVKSEGVGVDMFCALRAYVLTPRNRCA